MDVEGAQSPLKAQGNEWARMWEGAPGRGCAGHRAVWTLVCVLEDKELSLHPKEDVEGAKGSDFGRLSCV